MGKPTSSSASRFVCMALAGPEGSGAATYDVVFKLGEDAVYGSYNLIYTGKITEKSVWIEESHG